MIDITKIPLYNESRLYIFILEGIDDVNFFTPPEITKNTVDLGITKANMPLKKILVLAFLAGAYVSFAAVASTIVSHDIANYLGTGISRFMTGVLFSIGLMLVIICGAELFTGNCLLIIGVMEKQIPTTLMFKNWFYVYTANFAGALVIVYLMKESSLWDLNSFHHGSYLVKIALTKMNLSFSEAFTRGILANWLVCLAVWMAYASKDYLGKIFGVFFIITAFAASGFEHSIANMYYIPAGIIASNIPGVVQAGQFAPEAFSNLTWTAFLMKNLVPVTLGNIIGGLLVGISYWAAFLQKEPVCTFALKNNEAKAKVQV